MTVLRRRAVNVSTRGAGKQAKSSKVAIGVSKLAFSSKAKSLCASMLVAGLLVACGGGNSTNSAPPQVLSQGLWVANGTNVLEFMPSQLSGGTSAAAPHLMNNSSVF